MTFNKDKSIALAGTILIHLAILVLMLMTGFAKHIPASEEGLLVNFGNVDEAQGLFEPAGEEVTKPEISEVIPATQNKPDEIITQDIEKSVSLTEQNKQKEEVRKKAIEDQKRKEQERKATDIRNQAASVFGKPSGSGSSQGTSTTGSGNQGAVDGSVTSSNTKGGGYGSGHFSLNGRSTQGALPLPSYSIQEEGIVVVKIIVNPKGNVIQATVSPQGTNTDNATLRSSAVNAAKQARFNEIEGNQIQSGTITYQYRLR
jgi:TonB family protein